MVETLVACTEADFKKSMPRVREYCAKFARGVVREVPEHLCETCAWASKNVQRLCGICAAQFSHKNWGGASENVSARILHIFPTKLELFSSERPRGLLLSLGVPSRPLPGSDPGPVQVPSRTGPKGSRPDMPCALFYNVSDLSRFRAGGHPGPSWSHRGPERSF